jgi:hypothetical protein
MKPAEIVKLIKAETPELLGKLTEKKAAQIVRAALLLLGKQIAATDEGVVKVPGLGNFRIKNVERERKGQKVMVRRVGFIKAKAGATKKKKAEK